MPTKGQPLAKILALAADVLWDSCRLLVVKSGARLLPLPGLLHPRDKEGGIGGKCTALSNCTVLSLWKKA